MPNNLKSKVQKAKSILEKAFSKWPSSLALAWTGNKDSTVILHLIKELKKEINLPVFFIDNGLYPEESYEFMNKLSKSWNFDLTVVESKNRLRYLLARSKKAKSKVAADLKLKGIKKAFAKYKWQRVITAIRRSENPARKNEDYFSQRENHTRVHPILDFTEEDIWEYTRKNKLPYNPLYDQGYRSIGEADLTEPVRKAESERAGRDQYKEKVMKKLRGLGYF